jgi:hypothetical protein
MTIVSLVRLVFNVRGIDSDATSLFLGGFVDLSVVHEATSSSFSHDLCY